MRSHGGGCLCGKVRYETLTEPIRVTVCHCRFCQKGTGSAYMVEPIFALDALRVVSGSPATYETRSEGSGKTVRIHFCRDCATKLYLTFERFPDVCGVYAGTFDDPNWFEVGPQGSKHIFLGVARRETIVPAGTPVFERHAITNEGVPEESMILEHPQAAGEIAARRASERA